MQLPEAQVAVLKTADADTDRPITDMAEEADLKVETATGAALALEEEGLVSIAERDEETTTLTDEGGEYVEQGLPELRLYKTALEAGADDDPVSLGRLLDIGRAHV